MNNKNENHRNQIYKQFSNQAVPFTKLLAHYNAIDILIEMAQVSKNENVLDVASGPGIVACEFAKYAKNVIGIDLVPAMIEQATEFQMQNNLTNIQWEIGDVVKLPYVKNSFSRVLTRYSFHHFINYKKVFSEMIRVCKISGKILVADVAIAEVNSKKYDEMELIRDSSHVHALTVDEFEELFIESGLKNCKKTFYNVEIDLENQLKVSFPKKDDEKKLRAMIVDDIGVNDLGVNVRLKNGRVVYDVPIAVYVGEKV